MPPSAPTNVKWAPLRSSHDPNDAHYLLPGLQARKPANHPPPHTHTPHTHIKRKITNLQELGMNLSGSQDKPTLALTIPRSNQVVYKGFPSATCSFPFEQRPARALPPRRTGSHPRHDPGRRRRRNAHHRPIRKSLHAANYKFRRSPARLPA